MLESLTDYFAGLEPGWLYVALFISSYIENIFPPIPGDTVTLFAAYLVGRTNHNIVGVMAATTAGSSAGFMTYYALGRLIHPDYFVRRNFRFLPASGIERVGTWFRRFGSWVILVNRFFSSFRAVVSIVAGIFRLPWPRVFVLSLISCAVWNGLLIWAGYMLGANWALVENILTQYSRVLVAAAVLLAAVWFVRRRISRARRTSAGGQGDRGETD
jgi:membrane protein DedA with SNARE-associated domain